MNALTAAVQSALEQCGLWRSGAKLLCALSGGCDSVALLHALCRLRSRKDLLITAIHVQHSLRGADSLADEQFVRELCASQEVPLTVENAGLSGDMHTPGMETLARERRRAIFERELLRRNADALLTAHHQDDQAETVLMHLLRGSGMAGLCGMQISAKFGNALILRPFLSLPKRQLQQALAAEGLSFREDGSNQLPVTPRNQLRLSLFPQLDKLFPGACAHIAQTADTLSEDEKYLLGQAETLYAAIRCTAAPLFLLSIPPLAAAPEPIRRRVVRRWYEDGLRAAQLDPNERTLSREDTLALSALADRPAGTRINLPCGLMAARETDYLHLLHQSGEPLQTAAPYTIPLCAERSLYELPQMTILSAPAECIPRDSRTILLTPEWLSRSPVLRTPQPGDVIHPFGAPGSKPLRRFLTDRKADPFLRPAWPVLCVGSEVLWVHGLCVSEALRLEQIPSGSIQLTLSGETPFIPKPPKE